MNRTSKCRGDRFARTFPSGLRNSCILIGELYYPDGLQPALGSCRYLRRVTRFTRHPLQIPALAFALAASCVGMGWSGKRCGSSLLACLQAQATPYLALPAPMRMIRAWLLVADFYSPPSTHIAIICAPPPILADIAQTLQKSTHSHPLGLPCFRVLTRKAQWVSYPLRYAFKGAPCALKGRLWVRSWIYCRVLSNH